MASETRIAGAGSKGGKPGPSVVVKVKNGQG